MKYNAHIPTVKTAKIKRMNIFENESNLLSTFPSKPIMIIFTNRKTKQTVNTPPKIPVRTFGDSITVHRHQELCQQ